jgi:HSP20 family protein
MPNHPMREISSLHEAIDKLFEESTTTPKLVSMPQVNVYEKAGKIIVEADVPGIREENLAIDVSDDSVTISGERKEEIERSEDDFYRHEIIHGSFSRTVALSNLVDKDKAEAELKNGILTISLVKCAEVAPKVTKIKIKKN